MLVHQTEKQGVRVSVTLEQEQTELKVLWARAAAAYIHQHYPDLSLSTLLRCPINTATNRPASIVIPVDILEDEDREIN